MSLTRSSMILILIGVIVAGILVWGFATNWGSTAHGRPYDEKTGKVIFDPDTTQDTEQK